jgi:predicted nucleic acid-binding protein
VSLVLDSYATLAWIHAEETTPAVRQVFELLVKGGAWVPSLWRIEIANVLQMGIRRGRHDIAFQRATLADLASLPIRLDLETDRRAWDETLQLAHLYGLTLYGAAYLELARRRGLPLATLDADLRTAATAERLPLLGI